MFSKSCGKKKLLPECSGHFLHTLAVQDLLNVFLALQNAWPSELCFLKVQVRSHFLGLLGSSCQNVSQALYLRCIRRIALEVSQERCPTEMVLARVQWGLLELAGGSGISQPESLAHQISCDLMPCEKFLFCLS